MTEASGSLGGIVASHNRGGAYFRKRVVPVDPGSPQQEVVRQLVTQMAILWRTTLTQAQRDAWDVYGSNVPVPNVLGASIFLTGLQHYTRSNVSRVQAGLTRVDDAPIVMDLATFTPVTVDPPDAAADTVDVNFTDTDGWAGEVGGYLAVFASRPQNPSINFFKGPYRLAGVVLGAVVPPATPATITLPFPIGVGNKVFFQFRAGRADARLSGPFRINGTGV